MAGPLKHPFNLAIAIPASLTLDTPHLREKTFRIGLIARAAAIFRVSEIIVYPDLPDRDQRSDMNLIYTILSYMDTPQYLRRRLFQIVPELQYAGTLPPLRTPHHPTANRVKDLKLGEFRDGVVTSQSKEGSLVDVGVEQPALVQGVMLKPNTRVTVKIVEMGRHLKAAVADPSETRVYWGYRASVSRNPLGLLLKQRSFDLVIATSRKGKVLSAVLDGLGERWKNSHNTLVVFGAPTQGLYEIAAREHLKLDEAADYVINAIPNQATETVRTEEAVYATLSLLNALNE